MTATRDEVYRDRKQVRELLLELSPLLLPGPVGGAVVGHEAEGGDVDPAVQELGVEV